MLKTLSIENIAVIEKADIEFSTGLNALTGETGAGKSIVVDSINAILGERTSKDLVRTGAENAYVTAVFDGINMGVKAKLDELGIPSEEDTLILSRRISANGKSVCRINGIASTVSMLKEVGATLVNIHGQQDSQELLNPDFHYKFVDAYGGKPEILDEYKASFKSLLAVRRRLKELTTDAETRDKQLELLDYQIKELEQADIKVGEWQALKDRKNVILNSQAIVNAINVLQDAINGGDDYSGISTLVASATKDLSAVANVDKDISAIVDRLTALTDSVEQVKDLASSKLAQVDFSENELEQIEERLNLLYEFSNKYGETEEDMLNYLTDAIERRKAFDNSEDELERLNAEYDEAFAKTIELSQRLTAYRKDSAQRLADEICAQLEFLDMPKIKFSTNFEQGNLSSNGRDKLEFLISANLGEPPKPLSKIASGGELSRIMLAIKSVLAKNDSISTLIFDEIDTGVSGKASRKIGLKLKEVGESCQVICVTHSAQIASIANSHYLISKEYKNDRTYTDVKLLDYDGRKRELARIMGGLEITDALLLTAEEMLDDDEIVFI